MRRKTAYRVIAVSWRYVPSLRHGRSYVVDMSRALFRAGRLDGLRSVRTTDYAIRID
jgi:hypothetical protein